MKKVGVLTLYHVRNIGACLQAYAMREAIKLLGAKPYFIKGYDNSFAFQLFKGDTGNIRPWNIPFIIRKELKFRTFFREFPQIAMDEANRLDSIIIGSDSVWISKYQQAFMPSCYFGKINNKTVYAYAPSVGGAFDLDDYNKEQLEALNNLKAITVRDKKTQQFVTNVTKKEASLVADPTLLFDWNILLSQVKKPRGIPKEDYIFVYGGFNKEMTRKIEEYGNKNGLCVINVGIYNRQFKNSIAVSPYEFLHYMNDAKFVVTSMFHGVMIAISLNKEYRFISMDPNRNIKLSSTLEKLNLKNTILSKEQFMNDYIWDGHINYAMVNGCLSEYRSYSLDKLKRYVNGD